MAWLPVLMLGELARPRLGSSLRRWATVFPLGMYAAMSFTLAPVLGANGLTYFARIWIWIALACWALVSLASLRSLTGRSDA